MKPVSVLPLLLAVGAVLFGTPSPARGGDGDAPPPPDPEAAVRKRIAEGRDAARELRVDGRDGDWKGFLEVKDPRGDGKPSGLDITGIAIAPRSTDIVIMVRTASTRGREEGSLRIEVDLLGFTGWDVEVVPLEKGGCIVRPMLEGAPRGETVQAAVESAFGEVVEVRLPLWAVARGLPAPVGEQLLKGTRRPWVRARATSRDGQGKPVDRGPAVASFLLVDDPGALDAPSPLDEAHRRPVGLPVDGVWFVRQGAFGLWSHREVWAYDLSAVDLSLDPGPPDAAVNDSFLAWGRELRAPEAARVLIAQDGAPDNLPGDVKTVTGRASATPGNQVWIRFADGLRMELNHLRAESVAVLRGEDIEAGTLMGQVGNSGVSGVPHLHIALHERPGEFRGVPMTLKNVRVSLNPGADDPWARELPAWEVREGMFVEAKP